LLLGKKKPALYYAWGEEYYENPKNAGQLDWQDLHDDDKTCMQVELLRARIGEWTITRMLDYWRVMCFTGYRLNWNPWIWIPFPIDSDCTLLYSQVDRTRYSSIASGNNCIVQLCKCVSLHLKCALWIHPVYS
jgi:hypothetical protein